MSRSQTAAIYLLAIAIFCLAVVLVYFTVTVKKVSQDIPGIMESISQIKGQIPSILKESAAVRQDVIIFSYPSTDFLFLSERLLACLKDQWLIFPIIAS